MKIPDSERDQFLRELFENENDGGAPTAEQISRLVRSDRQQRQQRRTALVAIAAVAVLVALQLRPSREIPLAGNPPVPPPTVSVAEPVIRQASFSVETINDAELLEMLKDQPVALASLPNGDRRLMMIISPRQER